MEPVKVLVDFGFQFKDQTGKDAKNVKPANEVIAEFLFMGVSPEKSDKVAKFNLAMKMHETPKIELTGEQIDFILPSCESGRMLDGFYVQVEEVIKDAKEKLAKLKEERKNLKKE